MQPHAVFIDFDGTLGHHGIVPKAHVEAIARLRENGHYAFLCTGRPHCMVPESVLDIMDGFVGAAGAFVKIGGQVLRDDRFPAHLAERTIEVLRDAAVPHVLEAPEAMYGNTATRDYLKQLLTTFDTPRESIAEGSIGGGASDIMNTLVVRENLEGTSFGKAVIWGSPTPITELGEAIGSEIRPMPNSIDDDGQNAGELQLWSIDKVHGVRMVAEHLGIDMTNTVACGDGMNDVDMLRGAGKSVVIEGSDAAKAVSDATVATAGPLSGGLVPAFEKLGLI